MENIHNLLNRPDKSSDYEVAQRRRTLKAMLWVIFTGGLALGITNFIYGFFMAGITILVLCAACLAAMRLNQKGHYRAAAAIVSALLFFVVVFDIVDAGGIGNDLGMVAIPALILTCSIFLGKRILIVISSLCVLAVGIIGVLDIQKVIFAPLVYSDWGDLFTALVLLACTAALLWVLLENAEKNLKKIESDDASVRVSYELTLEGLVKTLELRDQETEHHSRRVVDLSLKLADALGLSDEDRLIIRRGALLHDIGKLGVPDHILLKPGPLDKEEWIEMCKHPEYSRAIMANIPFLQPCINIPYSHHERWDGTGYPCGLKAQEIPYHARLFSIVDIWEALTSDRVYRKAWPREKALAYLRENSGKITDPEITAVFLDSIESFDSQPELDTASLKADLGEAVLDNPYKSIGKNVLSGIKKLWLGQDPGSSFDADQRKQTLNVILWVVFIGAQGLGWVNLFSGGLTPVVWIIFALSGFCLLVLYINFKGYYIISATVISLLMLFAAGINLYTWGGLHDSGMVAFPVIVVICGLFFGKRGLISYTLLSAFAVSWVGILEINHLFIPKRINTDIWDVIILVIFILGTSVLLWSILDHAEKTRLRIKKKEVELKESYDLTLEGFARALEFRGREPKGHNQRVMKLSLRLAEKIGLAGSELEAVRRGALLHDIGTLFVPDRILLKPSPLNEDEWEVMRKHPERARELLAKIPYLHSCIAIPYCHHEAWDGMGYPQGLKGEDIPLAARLFTLVDQWEELSSDRPFRSAWEPEDVLNYIRENSGKLYDPHLTTVFLELMAAS